MKTGTSSLRELIREILKEQGILSLMNQFAGMCAGGAGLSQPTANVGGVGNVPPGLGTEKEEEKAMFELQEKILREWLAA